VRENRRRGKEKKKKNVRAETTKRGQLETPRPNLVKTEYVRKKFGRKKRTNDRGDNASGTRGWTNDLHT